MAKVINLTLVPHPGYEVKFECLIVDCGGTTDALALHVPYANVAANLNSG